MGGLVQAAGVLAADSTDVGADIAAEALKIAPVLAGIGATGVGLSLSVILWPKGVAFFKKVFKI